MKRYIVRGYENAVTEALKEHGLACILGIPGVGKTTTTRYIALKLREQGIIPIILTSADTDITLKDKLVEFADDGGERHTILQIPIAAYQTIDKDLAKSIAEAIATVVNTTLQNKILKKVSVITEKSEMVKKFADVVKGVGKKLHIPKGIVESAKITLKEVSNFVDIEEVVKYGAEFCSCFLLGVDIVNLAKMLKGKGGELKLENKVAVIIDDVAGLNLSEKVALLTLVDWLRKNDAEVLLVRRINLEKEFIEISTEISDSYVGYANEIFADSRDARGFFEDKRQAVFMTTPDFDTFKEIIEANVEERLKPEDIESLFQASGGLPTLAILMHDIGVKYGEETEIDIYSSLEEAKTDVEKARATLKNVLNGIRSVYVKAKKEVNFALVALFVQPMAFDELEAFCKNSEIKKHVERRGYKFFPDLYDLKEIVEVREEPWDDGKRKFYELNENWVHMCPFLDVLCDNEEEVKKEVETVRSVLLDIMNEEEVRTGRFTSRMLFAVLDNITWLKEEANAKPIRQTLHWGAIALSSFPKRGFGFLPIVIELAKAVECDEPLASAYASQLIKISRVMNPSLEDMEGFKVIAEYLIRNPTENPVALAYRAETYSFIGVMLSDQGIKRTSYFYMEKAEQMMESVSNKKVRNIGEISVWLGKAELYSRSDINEAWNWAENALSGIEEVRKKINNYVSNEFVRDYCKPYVENAEEKLKTHLDECYRYAKYLIGTIYVHFDWLEEAETAFKEALKYSESIENVLLSQHRIARIKAIRDYLFKDWKELYEKAVEQDLQLELTSSLFAGYLLSCMLFEKKMKEKELKEALEHIRTNLTGYALLLGTAHRIFERFDREEVLNALKRLETELRETSVEVHASILRMLIENEKGKALKVAEAAVSAFVLASPLLCNLFAELAEGIRREDEETTNKALVKLFYSFV